MTQPAIALCPLGFLELPPPELVMLAAKAGFDAVNVRVRAAVAGGAAHPLVIGEAQFEQTRDRMRDTGVAIETIELIGLTRDLSIDALGPLFEGARALGASRVLASGDDPELEVVAGRFADLCDFAARFDMAVDLEFMRFREIKTIEQAARVVTLANRRNGFLIVDALHLFRSGGTLASVEATPAALISGVQLCDAPVMAPPDAELANEARQDRLPPGEGELPLLELLQRVCPDTLLSVEVPLAGARAAWPALRRMELLASSTRGLLTRRMPRRARCLTGSRLP
jgi:sugar phosphate isomerase/epimerase